MGTRYIYDLVLNIEPSYVENVTQEHLRINGFKSVISKSGEPFYECKSSSARRGFKYFYQNGVYHIEAWIGKIGKEININDGKFYATIPKTAYYNNIITLLGVLDQERQARQMQAPYYSQPNMQMQSPNYSQPNMQMQSPNYSQPLNNYSPSSLVFHNEVLKTNSRNAWIAFWLALGSLMLMFLSSFSILINVVSYTLAISYGLKSNKKGLAIASIIMNSVAIVVTIIRIALIALSY